MTYDDNYIFRHLKKIGSNELEYLSDGEPLPDGYVTDGFGNIYKIPKDGKLPFLRFSSLKEYKNDALADLLLFTYNWKTHEIEIYILHNDDDDRPGVNNYVYYDAYGLNPTDFIDNPIYWFTYVYEKVKEETLTI